MSTALVTGAAGFISSHLVEELLDRGYRVRGLDDLSTGSRENLTEVNGDEAFDLIEGDIRDPDVVARAMDGAESVFHLAAYTSVPGSFERARHVSEVNCAGTATVLETAVDAGVESAMLASSAAVYGSDVPVPVAESADTAPESPYAASKLYSEQLGRQFATEFGLDVVALRFFNVYGPRQDPEGEYATVIPKFTQLMLDGEQPTVFGDGEQTRDFVFVGDVIQACVAAVESGETGVYNVGRGERVSVNKLVGQLNEILGTNIEPVYDDPRPGDIRHSGADMAKTRDAFGFQAETGFEQGLEATVEYFIDDTSGTSGQ